MDECKALFCWFTVQYSHIPNFIQQLHFYSFWSTLRYMHLDWNLTHLIQSHYYITQTLHKNEVWPNISSGSYYGYFDCLNLKQFHHPLQISIFENLQFGIFLTKNLYRNSKTNSIMVKLQVDNATYTRRNYMHLNITM